MYLNYSSPRLKNYNQQVQLENNNMLNVHNIVIKTFLILFQFAPDTNAPTIIFALVALISGILSTQLPETLNTTMPQTMEDGEEFGKNDTCFSTGCFGRSKKMTTTKDIPLECY